MAHEWESINPAPGSDYFKYFGCVDLRKCKKCKVIQEKQAEHLWMRVTGYKWRPKVGRCPKDKKGAKNGNQIRRQGKGYDHRV